MSNMKKFKSLLSHCLTLMIIVSTVPTSMATAFASTITTSETNSPTTPKDEDDFTLNLSRRDKPELLNLYTEKNYEVFLTLHNASSSGIYSIGQQTDGSPVLYDSVTLDTIKEKGTKVYGWSGGKWTVQTSYPPDEYGLRVISWSNEKWSEKVYRFTNASGKVNPFKSQSSLNIQRDSSGHWYMSARINYEDYIYQLDDSLKVKHSSNVSILTSSKYSNYYLLTSGKVILETYDFDESIPGSEWSDTYRTYNLQLLNLEQDEITKYYSIGYDIDRYVRVNGKDIYIRDKSKENIIVLDSNTGKLSKVIALADYEDLAKVHDNSQELGSKYYNDYVISGKYLYLLKKTGIYRIDLDNGKYREIMDGSSKPFEIQDMVFLDFAVKDENNMYILAVFFDERFPSNFYTYTK